MLSKSGRHHQRSISSSELECRVAQKPMKESRFSRAFNGSPFTTSQAPLARFLTAVKERASSARKAGSYSDLSDTMPDEPPSTRSRHRSTQPLRSYFHRRMSVTSSSKPSPHTMHELPTLQPFTYQSPTSPSSEGHISSLPTSVVTSPATSRPVSSSSRHESTNIPRKRFTITADFANLARTASGLHVFL